jgi:hypothetical protein
VCYRDADDNNAWARVAGHGWHKGRRLVFLHTGSWCYREDVRCVQTVRRSKKLSQVLVCDSMTRKANRNPQEGEP